MARRYHQFKRLLETLKVLLQYRFGLTITEVNERMVTIVGSHHIRTTHRDLIFLDEVGEVEIVPTTTGITRYRCKTKGNTSA